MTRMSDVVSPDILMAAEIEVGKHHKISIGGIEFHIDTIATTCIAVGEPKIGIFVCVGLLLGWLNTAMVVSATAKFAAENADAEEPNKKKFMAAVVKRLALITLIAGYIMFAFRPDGLAVLFGLAFFKFAEHVNLITN